MSGAAISMESEQLLKQAAEWRLIALLFECPTPSWRANVEALTRTIEDEALQTAAQLALAQSSEGIYHSVLGPGGPVPPREVSYHEVVQLGSLMSELAGYYSAFAYDPVASEAGDHISIEAGFIAYLRMKQAYAQVCEDAERAAITSEAAQRFVAEHLSVMAGPLAESLRHSGIEYLARSAEALLERVGPARGTAQPRAGIDLPECEWECGQV